MFLVYYHRPSKWRFSLLKKKFKTKEKATVHFMAIVKRFDIKLCDVVFMVDTNNRHRYSICVSKDVDREYEFVLELSEGMYLKNIKKNKLEQEVDLLNDAIDNPDSFGFRKFVYEH